MTEKNFKKEVKELIVSVIYFILAVLTACTMFISCDAFIMAISCPADFTEYYYTFGLLIFIGVCFYLTNKFIDK